MEKFIPYEKLSKKEKRKVDQAKRQTWGELNPVTRMPANSKAYNRNKARNWKREMHHKPVPGIYFLEIIRYNSSKYAGSIFYAGTRSKPYRFFKNKLDGVIKIAITLN